MAKTHFKSVDDYLASQPAAVQAVLQRVRSAVRKALPEADEMISYQIPTYKLRGRPVIYFAGWKEHYSLYPSTAGVVTAFGQELGRYEVAKGTIRFPLTEPVPVKLIAGIAKLRGREVTERTRPKPAPGTGAGDRRSPARRPRATG